MVPPPSSCQKYMTMMFRYHAKIVQWLGRFFSIMHGMDGRCLPRVCAAFLPCSLVFFFFVFFFFFDPRIPYRSCSLTPVARTHEPPTGLPVESWPFSFLFCSSKISGPGDMSVADWLVSVGYTRFGQDQDLLSSARLVLQDHSLMLKIFCAE